MTIPADHIHIDGQFAWLVGDSGWVADFTHDRDRPCDTCGGSGERKVDRYGQVWGDRLAEAMPSIIVGTTTCPDCDGTGRHTFAIAVGQCVCGGDSPPADFCDGVNVWRVSVVPGIVLPIVAWFDQRSIASLDHFIVVGSPTNPAWAKRYERGADIGRSMCDVTLPPAAQPGMWAVKLEVYQ